VIDLKAKFDEGNIAKSLSRFEKSISTEILISGVAAGARIIYNEVKANAAKHEGTIRPKPPFTKGTKPAEPLNESIYRTLSKERSVNGVQVYHVGVNRQKAPHGMFLEFGTSKQPARPFIRPALPKLNIATKEAQKKISSKVREKLAKGIV